MQKSAYQLHRFDVKAPIPRKQGLKLRAEELPTTIYMVKAPIPRKQGLKLFAPFSIDIHYIAVKAPIPRKQGLKLSFSKITENIF